MVKLRGGILVKNTCLPMDQVLLCLILIYRVTAWLKKGGTGSSSISFLGPTEGSLHRTKALTAKELLFSLLLLPFKLREAASGKRRGEVRLSRGSSLAPRSASLPFTFLESPFLSVRACMARKESRGEQGQLFWWLFVQSCKVN